MTKYHGRLSPTQVMKALNHFAFVINETEDPAIKQGLFESAWRFAIAEARKNDKFPHTTFIQRLSERTGVELGERV